MMTDRLTEKASNVGRSSSSTEKSCSKKRRPFREPFQFRPRTCHDLFVFCLSDEPVALANSTYLDMTYTQTNLCVDNTL